jgi:LemA protein
MGEKTDYFCVFVCIGIVLILILMTIASYYDEAFYGIINTYWPWFILFPIIIILYYILKGFIKVYNWFSTEYNAAEGSLNQIRVSMKKRLDMIQRLFELVQSYAIFEKETFTAVTAMRSALKIASPSSLDQLEIESQSLFGRLMAVAENYPQLKTSNVVRDLSYSITSIENEISSNRYAYNAIVQEFNTKMDTIPTNIVGHISGFRKLKYLEFEDAIKIAPKTKF